MKGGVQLDKCCIFMDQQFNTDVRGWKLEIWDRDWFLLGPGKGLQSFLPHVSTFFLV